LLSGVQSSFGLRMSGFCLVLPWRARRPRSPKPLVFGAFDLCRFVCIWVARGACAPQMLCFSQLKATCGVNPKSQPASNDFPPQSGSTPYSDFQIFEGRFHRKTQCWVNLKPVCLQFFYQIAISSTEK
jgi:hypothetical protein